MGKTGKLIGNKLHLKTDILCRYHVIEPLKFRTGDIVEAQVSFVAVPLKEKKFKLIIVMRALTLLDCTPLKVCLNTV